MPRHRTTLGRILIDQAIPDSMRDPERVFNKKTSSAFFQELAEKHPDEYVTVLKRLSDISRIVATEYGGTSSLRLTDLRLPPKTKAYRKQLQEKIRSISQSRVLTSEQKDEKIMSTMQKAMPTIQKTLLAELGERPNAYGEMVKQGLRGSSTQLTQLLFGDMLVADHKGQPVPIPGLHGYGEGVTGPEFWAGSYASRKGYCLAPSTLVRMADTSVKRIEDIAPGDVVLGADKDGKTYPVEVIARHYNGVHVIYRYYFGKGSAIYIEATPDHKILADSDGEMVPIASTDKGLVSDKTIILDEQANDVPGFLQKKEETTPIGLSPTYDLEVDHPDHRFVLANGLIVSNSDVQFATAKTGFLGKQLAAMSQHIRITGKDCGASDVGLMVAGDDPEILGSVIAKDVDGVSRNTAVSRKDLAALRGKKVMIRSLLTCQMPEGVCQMCSGKRDQNRFPPLGAYIGIESARVLSEPMTQQLALSAKHLGGVVGVNDSNVSGFDEVNQFVQVPKTFKGGAILTPQDGKVTNITDAPQGGRYVHINNEVVYVPNTRKLTVRIGDDVSAGDSLSDGTPNPAQIAEMKGLGEGRKYFQDKFYEILTKNGVPSHRRNVEVLSRAFFDKVRITRPEGVMGYAISDIVPYTQLANEYKPRKDATEANPKRAVGKYLEKPVLHYSIGTRVTSKIAKDLEDSGVETIVTHKENPGFEPHVVRAMGVLGSDPDWKVRLSGFGLKKSFLESAQLGSSSPHEGTSYVPKVLDPVRL